MKKQIKCIDCVSNEVVEITLNDNLVTNVESGISDETSNMYCGSGLVDLQINGFSGVDFNTYPIAENDFLKVIDTLVKEGVTTFLPTVITNSDEAIMSLLENINALCKNNDFINSFVGGVHLEGPFISTLNGAKGAHDNKYIKAPDWDLFSKFQKASGGRIKIVTISPEWDNSISFIEKCVKNNVIVAIGHTVASPEQINAAALAGASMSTHLGNGAPLELPRNSNFILEQLANDNLTASLIADGFHLPDSFLKVALTVKKDKVVLVSDSTMFAGMKPGTYNSHIGGDVVLEKGGRLSMKKNNKILAGAAISLLFCVNKLIKSNLASVGEAWNMASQKPQNLLNHSRKMNESNDMVLFELIDDEIQIREVFKNGTSIYQNYTSVQGTVDLRT